VTRAPDGHSPRTGARPTARAPHRPRAPRREPIQRQVRIEGPVERVPEAESDAYFASRPKGSRIGAWASDQSAVVPGGRGELEARAARAAERYAADDAAVPRPPHWGGYVVRPEAIEFWQGRPNRLHDRVQYVRGEGGRWATQRLSP